MKITDISLQARNKNRVNISVDGKYRFSLDVFQLGELGLRVGGEFNDDQLQSLEIESQFGKLYGRTLEYCLMRLHSAREIRDYLYRKTRPSCTKLGELKPGISSEIANRVFERLSEKGYIDDQKFARFWVENRSLNKGSSRRKLVSELRAKGVSGEIIDYIFAETERNDSEGIKKIISKKQAQYPDRQKLMMYLARQGFDFEDIKKSLNEE